jgi:hypothetical protein
VNYFSLVSSFVWGIETQPIVWVEETRDASERIMFIVRWKKSINMILSSALNHSQKILELIRDARYAK